MNNTILHDLAANAYQQSEAAYTEAIKAREQMDEVVNAVPVENEALYQRTLAVRELCVQAINAAWKAQHAIEELTGEI